MFQRVKTICFGSRKSGRQRIRCFRVRITTTAKLNDRPGELCGLFSLYNNCLKQSRRKTDTSLLPLKAQNVLSDLDRLTAPLEPVKAKSRRGKNPIGSIGISCFLILCDLKFFLSHSIKLKNETRKSTPCQSESQTAATWLELARLETDPIV